MCFVSASEWASSLSPKIFIKLFILPQPLLISQTTILHPAISMKVLIHKIWTPGRYRSTWSSSLALVVPASEPMFPHQIRNMFTTTKNSSLLQLLVHSWAAIGATNSQEKLPRLKPYGSAFSVRYCFIQRQREFALTPLATWVCVRSVYWTRWTTSSWTS